ncbi:DUF2812 domain-containing protein [Desulfitobacterium sp. PCE1]|uniref:DUF2812 domain-containing protein n=1 Tax=Desulfitobacterium sp. PCE1 TaxID=146907 RepID=UPI00036B47D5|nr:DUF2812 domain-containing protein [Desulfitobacterium sp. PCE1]
MLKFKLYYDKDAEEDWLKKMCLKGWALKKFFLGFYTFEKCDPGEYNYQIDLLDSWNGEKDDYAAFMEDTGVKVIAQWWRWVYLQKRASDGPFEMYTDVESKIAHYSRIKNFFKAVLVIEVMCFFIELMAAINIGSYAFGIFTVLLAGLSLVIFKMIWSCNWKIQQYNHERMM